MNLIDLLKKANESMKAAKFLEAKGFLEMALDLKMDKGIRSVVYEQLGICCMNINDNEGVMYYFELLSMDEEYERIDDVYYALTKLYRDLKRYEDMYRTARKIKARLSSEGMLKQLEQLFYELWQKQNDPSDTELERQRSYIFEYSPKMSIVVPVYNTKVEFLVQLIESVCSQTYFNWELCLADGNSSDEEIRATIRKYAQLDERIKYTFLDKNLGISENTNAAIKIAAGDYVVFMDHDDLLSKNALFEFVKALEADGGLDFIYSDHDLIDINEKSENVRTTPYFKPDWSPMLFELINYIVHPVVIRMEFMKRIGLLRKENDLLQDTELLYRVMDNTNKIHHIPKVLYHWRMHSERVSHIIDLEPETYRKKVVRMYKEHYSRINRPYITTVYEIVEVSDRVMPKISIIIINVGSLRHLEKCIESIRSTAGYENYEIIIIDKTGSDIEALNYFEKLRQSGTALIVFQNECARGFSSVYNSAAEIAQGEYFVFTSSACEFVEKDWIRSFLKMQQYPNTGLMGCGINYLDEAGDFMYFSGMQFVGINNEIEHMYDRKHKRIILCPDEIQSDGRRLRVRNVTALDSTCVMIDKELFISLGGFDAGLPYTFYVFDLCLKAGKAGYYNVWINGIKLNHTQIMSDGYYEAQKCYREEIDIFKKRYKNELIKDDPFFNINFSVDNYERNGCLYNIRNEE